MYTLQGKTRPTCHTLFMFGSRMALDHMYITWSTYSNLSRSHHSDGQSHYFQEKGLPTQSTTRWLTDLQVCTQFLSCVSHWSSEGRVTLCWCQTTMLTGLIYRHAIGTFNTCSREPTHRSLTDTAGATTLEVLTFHIPLPDLPNQRSPLFI
jgi:hypothetical protein